MRWLLPFPFVSASLLAIWLLLTQSLSLGHIFLGCVVALLGGLAFAMLQPPRTRARRITVIGRLSLSVLADIIQSNIAVGRIILGLGKRRRASGFVNIPLEMNNPYGLAILACIITATPGTLWVSFNSAKAMLMIHVLDLVDENQWVDRIKDRYERPLREIFE